MTKKKSMETNHESDRSLSSCPHCGSDKIWRVQRSEMEKVIYYLSNGKYAVRKYLCNACSHTTLVHNYGIKHSVVQLHKTNKPDFITCSACGADKLEMEMVSPEEGKEYHSATGKTIFRKLKCLGCMNETIISKEDYEAYNKEEL